MTRLLFALILSISSLSLFSQNITWTNLNSFPSDKFKSFTIHKSGDDSFLAINRLGEIRFHVSKYNLHTGETIISNSIKLKFDKKRYDYISTIELNHNSYFLLSRKKKVYAAKIDPNSLTVSNPQFLFEQGYWWTLKYSISPDQKTILLYLSNEKIRLYTFDSNFEPLWQNEFVVKAPKSSDTRKLEVDNRSNVFFVTQSWSEDDIVHYLTMSGTKYQKLKIAKTKLVIDKQHLIWSPEPGVINFWGFYGNKKAKDRISGYFFQQFDFNNVASTRPQLFPLAESYKALSPRIEKRVLKKQNRYNGLFHAPKMSYLLTDDSTHYSIIIMEHNSMGFGMWGEQGMNNNYYSGAIECVLINESGQIVWNKVINKRQSTVDNPGRLSYCVVYSNKKIYILFNDREENLNNRKLQQNVSNYRLMKMSKHATAFTLTAIDYNGNLTEKIIPTKRGVKIYPNYSGNLTNSKGILIGRDNYKYKLGIITFDD